MTAAEELFGWIMQMADNAVAFRTASKSVFSVVAGPPGNSHWPANTPSGILEMRYRFLFIINATSSLLMVV
jgi:hypothetical protein